MNCSNCGRQVAEDSPFCPGCGAVPDNRENAPREFVIIEPGSQSNNKPAINPKRKLIAVFITFALIAGLVPVEILLFNLDKQSQDIQRQWPNVSGIVTALDIEYTGSDFFEDKYDLHVDYEYQVQGVTYHDDLSWEVNSPSENHGYFPGKNITVYYDPAQPSRAYIQLRPSGWVVPLILMPLIIIIGCAVIWKWALKRKRIKINEQSYRIF